MTEETKAPGPGIYEDVPFEEYLKWPYFSKSMFGPVMKSARHLRHYIENSKQTKPMVMGSLVDALLFDRDELVKYPVLPATYIHDKTGEEKPWNGNANVCKNILADLMEQGTPVKAAEMEAAELIAGGVRLHPVAAKILETSKFQTSIVWDDDFTGVRCRARFDAISESAIVDLKTTVDASRDAFARNLTFMNYAVQAGMYTNGAEKLGIGNLPFNFMVAESQAPHCCAVYDLKKESINAGLIQARMAMSRYSDIMQYDPNMIGGYSQYIEPIEMLPWAEDKAFKEGEDVDL